MFGFPAAPLDIDVILAEIDKECTVVTDSPPIAPGIPSPQEAAEPTGIRPRRIDAASLDGKPVPDREWLVRDLIPAKNVTLLYGDGGTGKSLLALQLGAAVVTGRPFFAHIVKQGRVEFVTAEDSLDEMHRRLVDIAPLGSLSGFHLTSLAETDAMLAVAPDSRGGALAVTALYNELESVIAESRPVLVVLDTLADVFGGNEIIRAQARQFIGMLRRLCLRYDCTIVVLAHPSLAGMEKGTSGSTGWNNSVRSRLYFGRVHDGSDGSESDEDARVLRLGKSNYGRVGLEIPMRWRAGVFVSEGGAASGDPLVTAGKAERVFLELLDKANDRNSHVSGSLKANNYAPKVFARDALKQRVRKGDLIDAMDRLITSKRIENAPYGSPSRMHYRLQRIYVPAQPAPPL
jgi:RecA-family ATPase